MFRPMRRIKHLLSKDEYTSILKNEVRGVLSVLGENGYPYGIPMNFYYSEDESKICFHGAKEGHKTDFTKNCLTKAKELGFKILQFNAVVATNTFALNLYKKLGFTQLGTIPKGFLLKDGIYEDIIPHYIEL